MSPSCEPFPKHWARFALHSLRPYRWAALLYVSLAALAGLWGPFNSLLIRAIIDTLPHTTGQSLQPLAILGACLVLNFILFDNVTWRGIAYLHYRFQASLKNDILRQLMDACLLRTQSFFQDNLSGRIAKQVTNLADSMETLLTRTCADMVRGITLLLAAWVAAFQVDRVFCLILMLWFVAFGLLSLWMSWRLLQLEGEHAQCESKVSGQIVDTLSNQTHVRLFARRTYEIGRLEPFLQQTQRAFRKKEGLDLCILLVQGGLITLMMAFTVYCLISLYGKGLLTAGDFALILGLSMEVGHMTWYTMWRLNDGLKAVGKCQDSLDFLSSAPPLSDTPGAEQLRLTRGEIRFQGVHFSYPGQKPLFEDLSVIIQAGSKVGLVGYSGGGKSTFINLILRLHDVQAGTISLDGQDLRHITRDSLYQHLAIIPQDPTLFHRSLRENIAYGNPQACDADVTLAAQKAHAHDFISLLPDGYASLVGERGVKLSGGQRQRIALARAILKNAPILILDEATSQLDSMTEHLIQNSLWDIMQGKTTLVIAHRLSTLLHMDRILVLDQGKIVEDGSHLTLLGQGGLYSQLWSTQVDGFLPDSREQRQAHNLQASAS
jgi:ATP-binding cassette subfamily B protein